MAKVILRNNWWARDHLYRRGGTKLTAVHIPDELVPHLPKSAKVVADEYVEPAPEPEKSPDTLSEHRKMLDANDPTRAAMKAQAEVVAEAQETQENQRRERAAKFQAEVAAEETGAQEVDTSETLEQAKPKDVKSQSGTPETEADPQNPTVETKSQPKKGRKGKKDA